MQSEYKGDDQNDIVGSRSNLVETNKNVEQEDQQNQHRKQQVVQEQQQHQRNLHNRKNVKQKKKRHPLKMPLRTNPVTNNTICRFHNYDAKSGCKKYNNKNNNDSQKAAVICPLDHETCHVCLQEGHLAHECLHLDNPSSQIWIDFLCLTLQNTRPDDYPNHKTALGNAIVWIGDEYECKNVVDCHENCSSAAASDAAAAKQKTKRTILSPPNLPGFSLRTDDPLLRCRRQKQAEANFLKDLGHGAVVVDVGAHLGDTILTLALYARNGPIHRHDLRFVAIEPCPIKCEFIKRAMVANQLLPSTIAVICAAVGESCGVCQPEANAKERHARDGSLRYERIVTTPNNDDATTSNNVPIITLDSVANQITPLGLLHIDVEGWEPSVLKGARQVLTETATLKSSLNRPKNNHRYPCYIIAEAWTEKECLRRGVRGNAEEAIVGVIKDEINSNIALLGNTISQFERLDDIVDVERNLVYVHW